MRFSSRSGLVGIALAVVLFALAPLAHADTINYVYTYTGNAFTDLENGYTCQPGDGPCSIQGSLTLSSPLGDSFSGEVQPLSYSFTDGTTVLNDSNSSDYATSEGVLGDSGFSFTTDASGQVTSWDFELLLDSNTSWNIESSPAEDKVFAGSTGPASNLNDGGTWVETEVVTPEPATWALFGTGALALLGLGLRKRRPEMSKAA